jgi:hypothetical protein
MNNEQSLLQISLKAIHLKRYFRVDGILTNSSSSAGKLAGPPLALFAPALYGEQI